MKYECIGCERKCRAETDFQPARCLGRGFIGDSLWHPVTEPAPKLPDWVKVGAIVYCKNLNLYGKIAIVKNEVGVTAVDFFGSTRGGCMSHELTPARVRPWTFEEAPLQFKTKDDAFVFVFLVGKWGYFAKKENRKYTLSEVTKLIQLSGEPCGVLGVAEVGK